MKRPHLVPWDCPLCEREVSAVNMWRYHREPTDIGAVYFHVDGERCFVADQRVSATVSLISEIDLPGENIPDP